MLTDYHMHTSFSDDSEYPMEEAVKRAVALKFDEICFTEHMDYGVKTDLNCDYSAFFPEIARCREKYRDQITIRAGVEFGMQIHTVSRFQQDFDRYPFDFVILSCHQVEDKEFWRQDFQRDHSQEEVNRRYYEEILGVMERYEDYSVLGHLDAIKRDDKVGEYPFEKVKNLVTEILTLAIKQGKGIELNTSCFRYGLKDLTPSREILSLYHKLGGKIITLGSDSHKEEHLGYKIPYAMEELKKLGFTEFCTFEKMEPTFHPL